MPQKRRVLSEQVDKEICDMHPAYLMRTSNQLPFAFESGKDISRRRQQRGDSHTCRHPDDGLQNPLSDLPTVRQPGTADVAHHRDTTDVSPFLYIRISNFYYSMIYPSKLIRVTILLLMIVFVHHHYFLHCSCSSSPPNVISKTFNY